MTTATSVTLLGYRMFHVSVGLVPVWTIVGYADSNPTGMAGIVAGVGFAAWERGDTKVPNAMADANTAVKWLVCTAGCMDEIWHKTTWDGSLCDGGRDWDGTGDWDGTEAGRD